MKKVFNTEQGIQKAMRRGELYIESTLDLHGMSVEQSQILLDRFISEMFKLKKFYLLIITGKGKGILRDATHKYLSNFYSDKIRYIKKAHIKDGGDGAFYVILKKKKK